MAEGSPEAIVLHKVVTMCHEGAFEGNNSKNERLDVLHMFLSILDHEMS